MPQKQSLLFEQVSTAPPTNERTLVFVGLSADALFTKTARCNATETVEAALWAAKFSGRIAERERLAVTLKERLLEVFLADTEFMNELTSSTEPAMFARDLVAGWVRAACRKEVDHARPPTR